jgi:hydroxymethylbilane synthase
VSDQLVRIATRASPQARTQAEAVATLLQAHGCDTELVFVETLGDRSQGDNTPLHSIGGQGVFVKEVQRAVLDGQADIAVHSAKDLPSLPAEGLSIGAFCVRRDARDALIGSTLDGLALGATIATGSVRRRAQLHAIRPDLRFVELRGNIHTRLSKIPQGGAIVMAVAALEVLGLTDQIAQAMDNDVMVPAVGQGCVAVEMRTAATEIAEVVAVLDHRPTRQQVLAERAFLSELGTGCSLPLGAYVVNGMLTAFLANETQANETQRCVQLSIELGRDWAGVARDTARQMQATLRS